VREESGEGDHWTLQICDASQARNLSIIHHRAGEGG